ncbi:ornithine decarboxylase-like [Amphiura filiformis]|uniref:ornithine decarboxylase-like n=1 Tax=Amphiura filiformis TaxID=82378 RepID=UPI003B220805
MENNEEEEYKYYLNDGFYGSFLNMTCKPIVLIPSCLKERDDKTPTYPCSIWGQTCNGRDCITKHCQMPKLQVAEWVFFEAIGAYSIASASTFNGFSILPCYYVAPKCLQSLFQDAF